MLTVITFAWSTLMILLSLLWRIEANLHSENTVGYGERGSNFSIFSWNTSRVKRTRPSFEIWVWCDYFLFPAEIVDTRFRTRKNGEVASPRAGPYARLTVGRRTLQLSKFVSSVNLRFPAVMVAIG